MAEFSENDIKQAIQAIIGEKVYILPIGNHHLERNFVYYVKTHSGSSLIFKLYLKKNRWNREVASLELLKQSDILCPHIIDWGKLEDETEWLMTNYFDGYSLSLMQNVIDDHNKLSIYKDMGRQLGKLHSFKSFDFFGNWDENGNSVDNVNSYRVYFDKHIDSVLRELSNQSFPQEKLIKKAIKAVMDNIDILNCVTASCLCHNDFSERNSMVVKSNNHWTLQAIIDFEQSLPSDRDKDLTYICNQLARKSPSYEHAFLEGYTEFCCLSKDFYAKKEFYLLYFGLYICSWSFKQAPEHYLEGIQLLNALV